MNRIYLCIDLKSFYASVECVARELDPLTTNLVVADKERTDKTICLAVTPSLKAYGISGRARLFEVVQRVEEINRYRRSKAPGRKLDGESYDDPELKRNPSLALSYIVAPPRMSYYMETSARIYDVYLKFIAPEDIHVYSIDEVFIDLTPYLKTYQKTPREMAEMLIKEVLTTTGITATAGIGTNMYLAKVAIVSQLFNLLCTKADDEYGGRLPVHVRCLLDEVANITIPNLERLISVLRSREISACLVVQAQSQLKAIYKEHADTIIGNCDTTLFLGGKEKTTLKEISEVLGKETIDSFNTSENRGRDVSHGLNYQKLGKELMSQDEIAVMDGGKCILQLRGVRPFFSDKYDITRHPKYKYLSDYDKKNTFDIEKFLKRQRRPVIIKPDTVFDYYEIDAADLQEVTE